jgi:hypothetical protein
VRKKWLILASALLAAALAGGAAVAAVMETVLHEFEPAKIRVVRASFVPDAAQPTFSAGWHTHPGPVIIQVQAGHLKITQAMDGKCIKTNVGPGDTYIEVPELPINAEAKAPVTWTTTLVLPSSQPPRRPAAAPDCARH